MPVQLILKSWFCSDSVAYAPLSVNLNSLLHFVCVLIGKDIVHFFFFFCRGGFSFPLLMSYLINIVKISFIAVHNYFKMRSIIFWLNWKWWTKSHLKKNKKGNPPILRRIEIRGSCLHVLRGQHTFPHLIVYLASEMKLLQVCRFLF